MTQTIIDDFLLSESKHKGNKPYAIGNTIYPAIKEAEKTYDKSILDFTEEELRSLSKMFVVSRTRTAYFYENEIEVFVKWARKNGYEISQALDNFKIDVGSGMQERLVSSPKMLENRMSMVFDQISEETVDCIYRCFLWLGYMGFNRNIAPHITRDEVDFEKLEINHTDEIGHNTIKRIYPEALDTIREACTLKSFTYYHSNYSSPIRRGRYPGDELLCGIKSIIGKTTSTDNEINKRVRNKGIRLSYESAYYSGVMFEIYTEELAGNVVNLYNYVTTPDDGKESSKIKRRTERLCIKKDYEAWKEAFIKNML